MHTQTRGLRRILPVALLLLFATSLFAQESRGNISGSVIDPSGAKIPNATVTATELRTGVKSGTTSDAAGSYNIPFLAPGEYQIEASAAGFRNFVRRGLTLTSGDHQIVDLKMEVGQNSEAVVVTAEAPMIETADASTGQAITTKEVEDLPLNGRNPMMLAQLSIGVVATGQPSLVHPFDNGAASAWSIGGTPSQTAEILMDGAPNATWDNRVAYAPPQDSVQEVKVKAFDVDASFGHTSSGTINQVMKTGTNRMHGSAYWFTQPPGLGANSYFNKRAGLPIAETKYNQEGFTVGGPLVLPKLYNGHDKLFWFFGFERLDDSQPNTKLLTVPTTAERSGDLSALLGLGSSFQIYNPYTGTLSGSTVNRKPFFCDASGNPIAPNLTPGAGFGTQATGTACNKIPAALLSPVAQKYLALYPQPNTTGSNTGYGNYANTATTDDGYHNELGRLDWDMSQRSRLSIDARHNRQQQQKNNYFGNNTTGTMLTRENWGGTIDEVFTFSPTLVLDLRANYTRLDERHPSPSAGFDPTTLGFPSSLGTGATYLEIPAIAFGSSCGNDTTQASSFDCFGDTSSSILPSESYQIFGDITKQLSTHTLKFGVDARRYLLDADTYGASTGSFSFGTQWTNGPTASSAASSFGQDFAAFLLGLPTSGSYDLNSRGVYTSYYNAFFVQDDWRVKRSLTVNLGLRYDHDTPYAEKLGRTANGFDTTDPNPVAAAAIAAYNKKPISQIPVGQFAVPGGLTFANQNDPGVWNNDSHMVSPRVGFAWSPGMFNGNTVIRGGFGIFVQPLSLASLNPIGTYSSTPILTQQGYSQTTPLVVPSNFLQPSATLSNPFASGFLQPAGATAGLATFNGQNVSYLAGTQRNPYSERWTFGIQQMLSSNLVLEIAYIGNHSVHLPINFTQINSIPRQYLSTLPYRDAATITALSASVSNPFAGLLPGTGLNGSTTTVRQLLAPFPEFPVVDSTAFSSGITERNLDVGSSNFNSLDLRVEKRLSYGLSLIGNYQWSKLIEADSWLNASDPTPERRISPFDHTHHFVVAATYDLPIGRGRALNLESAWLNTLVGGWGLNAIYTYQTGAPIEWMNGSTNNPGDYPLCAVATVKGVCPNGANGVPQAITTIPVTVIDPRNTTSTAFDLSQFVTASAQQFQFHLRTLPTTFGWLRQDGINNFDASLIKRFAFGERMNFQFRAEAFNVLNHPTFGAPNTQVTSSNFGLITSQANRSRQMQLGLRFVF